MPRTLVVVGHCIDISESHLVGCARGFVGLVLKTRHVQFGGLGLKTTSRRFDHFGL
jgi:hypothetical protein